MPKLAGNLQAGGAVEGLLFRGQLAARRPALRRAAPAGELFVAHLGVGMAQPMYAVDAGAAALVLEALQLGLVGHPAGNEAPLAALGAHRVEQVPLLSRADRDFALLPALAPGGLQYQRVAAIRETRGELDRLGPAQAEGGLERERQARIGVGDALQLVRRQGRGLALVGDEAPVGDAIGVVAAGDDIGLVQLLGPPAQMRHPVLDRAGRELLPSPAVNQGLDMLGLQALGREVAKAQLVELGRHQGEDAFALGLRGVGTVAVAVAELLQLVVEVAHGVLSFTAVRQSSVGVQLSGKCFCSTCRP